ncbi:lipoprotein [Vibrio sp. JCM 19236]|nr:lipoprotein [Vibrio sp. JCM 19236]
MTKFFLVPTAGACIHTPPPPPNQIVLVDYPEGIELVSLATPVWVEGELFNQALNKTLTIAMVRVTLKRSIKSMRIL